MRGEDHPCDHQLDAGAYVLGALSPEEARTYARHVEGCMVCREVISGLEPPVSALARDIPAEPMPVSLRERIMREVRAEAELLAAAGPAADRPRSSPRQRRRTLRLAGLGGAVAAACGIAVGFLVGGGGGKVTHARTTYAFVAYPGARAELVRSAERAELVVQGLPQPSPGHIYQVWLARAAGDPIPTDALFSVSQTGSGSTDVPGDLHGVRRVMVTAEPLGGSRHPTTTPIIVAGT